MAGSDLPGDSKYERAIEDFTEGYRVSADQRVRTAYAMTDCAAAQARPFKTVA